VSNGLTERPAYIDLSRAPKQKGETLMARFLGAVDISTIIPVSDSP